MKMRSMDRLPITQIGRRTTCLRNQRLVERYVPLVPEEHFVPTTATAHGRPLLVDDRRLGVEKTSSRPASLDFVIQVGCIHLQHSSNVAEQLQFICHRSGESLFIQGQMCTQQTTGPVTGGLVDGVRGRRRSIHASQRRSSPRGPSRQPGSGSEKRGWPVMDRGASIHKVDQRSSVILQNQMSGMKFAASEFARMELDQVSTP